MWQSGSSEVFFLGWQTDIVRPLISGGHLNRSHFLGKIKLGANILGSLEGIFK